MAQAFIPGTPVAYREQSTSLATTVKDQQSQLQTASGQINALTARVMQLEEQLHAVYQSRSWRITGPIRTITDLVRARSRGSV